VRERWFGSTGRRVPEVVREGDEDVDLDGALVVEGVENERWLREAHEQGTPVVVRAGDAGAVRDALARPEVSCVLVPADRDDLLALDLRKLTYGA
jgi:hypothetical protein